MGTRVRLTESAGGVTFEVRVQPRASRAGLTGTQDGRLKIALTAPPVDGKANDALVGFLAQALDVPRRAVSILRGQTGRNKTVRIEGLTAARLETWIDTASGRR
jgi:uncharacterized protein